MKWTMGITQWCLPGNRDYTLRLAKQLGFDAVQLDQVLEPVPFRMRAIMNIRLRRFVLPANRQHHMV